MDHATAAPTESRQPNGQAGNPPPGYGYVARRIARRTTDLLAIALVLVAGLGLGGQLIGWWRAEPVPAGVAPVVEPDRWSQDGVPLMLGFGESPVSVERTSTAGSREAAVELLVDSCAATADRHFVQPVAAGTAGRRLVEATAHLEPVREEPGRWQVHVVDGPVVLAVALRLMPKARAAREGSDESPRPESGGQPRRADAIPVDESNPPGVLCWGLAFPANEHRWIVYLFRPSADRAIAGGGAIGEWLPPGSHRVFSAIDPAGGGVTMFEGPAPLSIWRDHITTRLKQSGFRESTTALAGTGWTARFESSDAERHTIIEIHITPSPSNTLTGIMTTHLDHRR